jgi:hypothetical protein
LKRGSTQETEAAVVEHVVSDGVYDVSKKSIAEQATVISPSSPKRPTPIREKDFFEGGDRLSPTQAGLTLTTKADISEGSELIELPPDPPKQTGFDLLFWPLSILALGIFSVLALNMRGIIHIPWLPDTFAPSTIRIPEIVSPPETGPVVPSNKHGFPKIDSAYDPWTGKPKETTTPTP